LERRRDRPAGRKAVARDETRRINEILYRDAELHSQRLRAPISDAAAFRLRRPSASRPQRQDPVVSASSTAKAGTSPGTVSFDCVLEVDGKKETFTLSSTKDQKADLERTIALAS
jgi:hypothetical protein